MFKKIKRYLVFLCVFAFATTNITELDVFFEEGTLEAASIETYSETSSETSHEASQVSEEEPELEVDVVTPVEDELEKPQADTSIVADLTAAVLPATEEEARQEQEEIEDFQDTSLKAVSYYIHTYKKLPPVYITKKEAYNLGGSLEEVMNKNSIGGDYFGNYQGLLPKKEGRTYRECDIDTLGTDSRGRKRLVYSNDGLMYYTDDHYETFTLLYSQWDNTNLQNL